MLLALLLNNAKTLGMIVPPTGRAEEVDFDDAY